MGKLFAGLGVTEDMEKTEDRIGGGRHFFDTDVYENATIKLAFAGKSDSGARYVTLIALIDGQEYEETIYITNSKGENFYTKDGKKNQMPGFVTINELCLTATGEELEDQDTEERQIEVWSYEDKKKVRQARDVLTGLTGATASLAIRKATQPKTKKTDRTGSDGKAIYEDTDEDVTINEIVKSFHPETRATVGEIRKAAKDGKDPEAKFIDEWAEKWKGSVQNKRKGASSASKGGASDGAPKSSGGDKPKSSLFAKS
jgi:hypothetical protein